VTTLLAQRPPCGGRKLPRENGPGAVCLDGDYASGTHDGAVRTRPARTWRDQYRRRRHQWLLLRQLSPALSAAGFQEMRPVLALAFTSLDAITGINRADTASEMRCFDAPRTRRRRRSSVPGQGNPPWPRPPLRVAGMARLPAPSPARLDTIWPLYILESVPRRGTDSILTRTESCPCGALPRGNEKRAAPSQRNCKG